MKYFSIQTIICFIMVSLLFIGIMTFSLMGLCPVDNGRCSEERESVPFPHDMHMDFYDCETCHHIYDENKENTLDPMELDNGGTNVQCSSCHDLNNKINTQEAFHRQCMGCHNEVAVLGQNIVPTACKECHRSESMVFTEYDMIIKGRR